MTRQILCQRYIFGIARPQLLRALFSTLMTLPSNKKKPALPPRPIWLINEEDLKESFIKGGGPGGQKINKCNSKVQITHLPTGIVVNSQYLREQKKNRKRAREILAMKLEQLQDPENCRLKAIEDQKKKTKKNKEKKTARTKKKLEQMLQNKTQESKQPEELIDIEQELQMVIERYTTKQKDKNDSFEANDSSGLTCSSGSSGLAGLNDTSDTSGKSGKSDTNDTNVNTA